jgi:competence protein ComEC
VIVVDTGRNGLQTSGFLRYRGRRDIDALLLTHGHPDHCGGLRYLEGRFAVKELWDNNQIAYPADIRSAALRRPLERGDTLRTGAYTITILHPYKGFFSPGRGNDAENDQSVVMKLEGKRLSVLFTGDISGGADEDITHLAGHLKSMVIKVPHHGSRKALSAGLLSQVEPEIAVISSGRNNRFGHPSPETLERLAGVRVFRTDRDGAVGIDERPDGRIVVKTWREMMIRRADTWDVELSNLRNLFSVW